jgi:hypothetical protein
LEREATLKGGLFVSGHAPIYAVNDTADDPEEGNLSDEMVRSRRGSGGIRLHSPDL